MSAIQIFKSNFRYLRSRISGAYSHPRAPTQTFDSSIDEFTLKRIRRFDSAFDFFHRCLDRLQDGLEILTAAMLRLFKTWRFKFAAGVITGLMALYLITWLF